MKTERILIAAIVLAIIALILYFLDVLPFRYTPNISSYVVLIAVIYLIINRAKEKL